MNDQKINTVKLLHHKAINLYELAQMMRGNCETSEQMIEYRELLIGALELERNAANKAESEPLRSTLYWSAASLAYLLGNHADVMRLASIGRSGNPPQHVASELFKLEKLALDSYGRIVKEFLSQTLRIDSINEIIKDLADKAKDSKVKE